LRLTDSLRLILFAALISLTTHACKTKDPTRTVETTPEPVAEPPLVAAESEPVEEPAPDPEPAPPEPEPEPDIREPEHAHQVELDLSPDPRQLLETALEALQDATEQWREGHIEEAITSLDQAYGMLLDIDEDEEGLDILQEKEDLRYLIAKRMVEVYASRRTAAGDVSKSIPIVMNEHVEYEIKSFQGRERRFFLESYKRSGRYMDMILAELRAQGLPEQLAWLPLIESGFKARAMSRARALGLWQFIPSTGYRYGLNRNQYIDERMDPDKATLAALAYLVDLHHLFGDWMSALAGYNCGEGRVLRAIKSQHINYLDDFWDLYDMLPRETARYVPRFLATLIILEDPEKYGFELPEVDPPMPIERMTVEKSVKLEDLDALAELPKGTFKSLNPELRYGITPEKPYDLRVPAEAMTTVTAGIDELQRYQLPADAHIRHRVRRGESLSTIARRYNSSVSAIVRTNRLRNQHRIRQGQILQIPRKNVRAVAVSGNAPTREETRESVLSHTVVRGDSLWRLAQKYKTSVNEIKALNGLRGNTLSLGQKLKIRAETTGPRYYTVRKGDTLGKIATAHRVRLSELLRANNMSRRDTIYPNQRLVVPQ